MKSQAFEYLISSQRPSHMLGVARLIGEQCPRDSASPEGAFPLCLPEKREWASPKVFKYQLELSKPEELQRHLGEQRRLLVEGKG